MWDKIRKKVEDGVDETRERVGEAGRTAADLYEQGNERIREERDIPQELEAWCSWCGEFSTHDIEVERIVARSTYRCRACEYQTIPCRWCQNMARAGVEVLVESKESESHEDVVERESVEGDREGLGDKVESFFTENWDNELCAEHDGSIPNFSKVGQTISDLNEFEELMAPAQKNLYSAAKNVGTVAGGAAMIGTGAWLSAPGIAAALGSAGTLGAASTGTAISTLSGAALSSASVTAIGTGGLAVITAAGAGLGGKAGYGLANSYLKDIPDYQFIFKRGAAEDDGHRVIVVDGFLTEETLDAIDWYKGLEGRYRNASVWYLNWEAKTLRKLGDMFHGGGRGAAIRNAVSKGVAKGSKKMGASVARGGGLLTAAEVAANPWHSAMLNAEKAGAVLAEAITRTEGKTFTLMGHSLGARLVFFALETLGTREEQRVKDAVLMGGALGNDKPEAWETAASSVHGTVYNCSSDNDGVLRYLYQGANIGLSKPVGLHGAPEPCSNIRNHDFTDLIDGHNEWKANLPNVLDRLETCGGEPG